MAEMNICDGMTHKTSKLTLVPATHRIVVHEASFISAHVKDYCHECFVAILDTYKTGSMKPETTYTLQRL